MCGLNEKVILKVWATLTQEVKIMENRFLSMSHRAQFAILFLIFLITCGMLEAGSYIYFRLRPDDAPKVAPAEVETFQDERRAGYMYYPYVSYRYPPNTKDVRPGLDTDKLGFIHNGNPLRDLNEKPTGTYRIFILGGSTVAGTFSSPETTLSGYLEKKLNKLISGSKHSRHKTVEVINTGVSGYFSAQEANYMIWYLNRLKPDVFVWLHCFNLFSYGFTVPTDNFYMADVNPYNIKQYQWLNKKIATREPVGQAVYKEMLQRSNFVRLLDVLITKLDLKDGGNSDAAKKNQDYLLNAPFWEWNSGTGSGTWKYDMDLTVRSYVNNLKTMIGFAQTHDVSIGIFLQPSLTFDKKLLSKKEKEILSVARDTYRVYKTKDGIEFLERKRLFFEKSGESFAKLKKEYQTERVVISDLKDILNHSQKTSYGDHCHYTDDGHDVITDAMVKLIAPLLQEPAPEIRTLR